MKIATTCVFGSALFFSLGTALADVGLSDVERAFDEAIANRNQIVEVLSEGSFRHLAQDTLNTLVEEGVAALRESGHRGRADARDREWRLRFSSALTAPSTMDLGDHRALSQFLADFYDELEGRIGRDATRRGLLGDIYQMNYAIPVTFAPKGEWWKSAASEAKNQDEYREHFVPFASIVTYYGALAGCQYIMKKQGNPDAAKRVCKPASQKLREAMARAIAPQLSDFIYLKATGQDAKLKLKPRDWVYESGRDLF